MCGIAGFFSKSQKFSRADLQNMTDTLSHRGPDAEGIFQDDIVGLGHKRLSILDLSSAANQPMHSRCGNYIIVYNGEVYNYKEITLKYNLTLRTNCDTEVILEAFALKGPEIAVELNGMFAFAIYKISEKKLFLFRDRIGIKPLFYYWDGKNLAFSSEIKSLLKISTIPLKELNKQAIANYLLMGSIPEPDTIYKNISKFPSGKYLEFDGDNFQFKIFWDLRSQISDEVLSDEKEAKDKLKSLIESSVRYRLISDVPFGIFLSGGIDSSLLTAVSSKIVDQPVKTFSIGFQESKYNETTYAREVSKYFKTDHYEFIVAQQEAFSLVETMVDLFDEPFADSSAIPTLMVSELAKKHVTMTLSGDGGDELFFGYGAYNWAKRLSNPLINTFRHPLNIILSAHPSNTYKRASHLFNYTEKERIKSHIFSQEQYYFSSSEIRKLLTDDFFMPISFDEEYSSLKRELSLDEEQSLFDIQYYLKDDLLVKVDRATMFHSLETRVPFLDDRIITFALNLDKNLKLRGREGKYILKQVLYDYIPEKYFIRPKWGFSIPLQDWLKGGLSHLIDEFTNENIIKKYNIVNYEYVKKLVAKFKAGHDYLYNKIWLIIILHKWLRKNNL